MLLEVLVAMQSVSSLVFQSVPLFSAYLLQCPLFISDESNFIISLYSSKSLQIYRNVWNSRCSKQSVAHCTDTASHTVFWYGGTECDRARFVALCLCMGQDVALIEREELQLHSF